MVRLSPLLTLPVKYSNPFFSSLSLPSFLPLLLPSLGRLHVCTKIVDLRPDGGHTSWIVAGCIYKEQPLKPSILDAFTGDKVVEQRTNYAHETDMLTLEDESGRVVLSGGYWNRALSSVSSSSPSSASQPIPLRLLINTLVTGVIVAIKGRVLDSGELAMDDICVPGLSLHPIPGIVPSTIPPPVYNPGSILSSVTNTASTTATTLSTSSSSTTSSVTKPQPLFLCLVSGLAVGGNRSSVSSVTAHPLALQLLSEYLTGMNGSNDEIQHSVRHIHRVIVAGGLISKPNIVNSSGGGTGNHSNKSSGSASTGSTIGQPSSSTNTSFFTDRNVAAAEAEAAAIPLREADQWLAQLCTTVPVDLMPGEGEPTSYALPQQPFHSVLFTQSSRFSSLHSVPNPYSVQLDQIRVLGHAGQPINDIARYTSSSHVTVPGDEFGLRGSNNNNHPSGSDSSVMTTEESSNRKGKSHHMMDTTMTTTTTSSTKHSSSSSSSSSSSNVAMEEEYDGNLDSNIINEQAIAAVISSTSEDKTLEMQAGTGAGSGYDIREKAGKGGDEILARLNPLDILVNTLYWRHMAPTAPDTLACHPFHEMDPFVIDRLPNIYFAGNQREYGSRLVTDPSGQIRIRCICVPDFASTHTIVLVDLTSPTFETQAVTFAVGGITDEGISSDGTVRMTTDEDNKLNQQHQQELLRLGLRYKGM